MVFMNEPAALVKLRRSALHDYRTAPMFEALNKFTSILPQDTGRGSHVLDLGLRFYVGHYCPESVDRALDVWEKITDRDHAKPVPVEEISSALLARTYSCLSYAYFELHQRASVGHAVPRDPDVLSQHLPTSTPDASLSNDLLYIAAVYADATAKHGLVSSTILQTASYILQLGTRDGVDVKRTTRYSPLTHLWNAEEASVREWEEEQRGMALEAATASRCAAPECEIEGVQTKYMRCGGKCPTMRKPRYCSKECQRRHWKTHRPWCKSDEDLAKDPPRPPGPATSRAPGKLEVDDVDVIIVGEAQPEMPDPGPRGADEAEPEQASGVDLRTLTPAVLAWARGRAAGRSSSSG
ncbi:hypothetical protein C8Q76DRAFT_796720 [Earliella scabrosa]|nr:hypothetical protein C8Q76DRAFT_796720 [Earliella scabrosa]